VVARAGREEEGEVGCGRGLETRKVRIEPGVLFYF
jgi:hypothetical protein